jgi:hypothetical protein
LQPFSQRQRKSRGIVQQTATDEPIEVTEQ